MRRDLADNAPGYRIARDTHFKNIVQQGIQEPKERTRIQAVKYFMSGEVNSDTVTMLCEELLWMNNPNNAAAVTASNETQAKWKSRTIKQLFDAIYGGAVTSGGVPRWKRLTPEQRVAIWRFQIDEAPSIIAGNALSAEKGSVSFSVIFLHPDPALEDWRIFTRKQILRVMESVWRYREQDGIWKFPGWTDDETALASDYKRRARGMEQLQLGTVMDVPTHASRTRGASRNFRPRVTNTPGMDLDDNDLNDNNFWWSENQ